MLGRRRPRVVIEDLEAQVFGDRAPDAPQPTGDAPFSSSAPVAPSSAPTSPAAVIVSSSVTPISPSAEDQERTVDITREEGRPEMTPRIEATPSPSAEPSSSAAAP